MFGLTTRQTGRPTVYRPTTPLLPSSNPPLPSLTSRCTFYRTNGLCVFDIDEQFRWTTYLIVFGLIGSAGYYAYLSFAPQPKKRKTAAPVVSAPVGPVTATGAGGYQEEWIPEHHLKKPKQRKSAKSGFATSGDETSGAEVSGTEGRKRKGKK